MADWRINFHELLEMYNIPKLCVYNGDQTGVYYYQKLPNWVCVQKDAKKTYHSVKQMKGKTRITFMVRTAANGSKIPLSIVGEPKKLML